MKLDNMGDETVSHCCTIFFCCLDLEMYDKYNIYDLSYSLESGNSLAVLPPAPMALFYL